MASNEVQQEKGVIWAWFPVTLLTAVFCCVLWGSASPAIKIAYEQFKIGPEDTASRIMLANTSGVRGSIINASGNFITILFAVYNFHFEKMTAKKLIGCLVGFAGILMILGGGQALMEGGRVTLAGEGAMLAADFFYAASGCLIKIFSRDENPVVLSGYQFMIGGAILFGIGTLMGGQLIFYSTACVLNLLYMGFISAGAYTLWGVLLKYNPVSRVAILGFINPVMGVLLSALFLGEGSEAFSLSGLLALLLVSAGIIIVNTSEKK